MWSLTMPSSDLPTPARRPREQLPIPLFGHAALAVRDDAGTIYLNVHDVCDAMEVAFSAQRRRILADDRLRTGFAQFRVRTPRGPSDQDFLQLELIPVWLMSIQLRRVSETVRAKLGYVQEYLLASVYAAFTRLAGLPAGPSREIEDLADLDQIDPAFQALEERQRALESSQDRARQVWRDMHAEISELRTRVRELEQVVKNRLAPEQRRVLYDMVHAWGHARAAHDSKLTAGQAIKACWGILNARFHVTSYTDIPAASYDDAIAFLKAQYAALTGEQLSTGEQEALGL
jgi:hypothetical protein